MSLPKIKKKLHNYIENGDPKKIKAFYTMVEEELIEYDHWDDPLFVQEMEKRVKEIENGKVKGIPYEIVRNRILKKQVARKKNK